MENQPWDAANELAEDLSRIYRDIEKSRALHLEISELMLSVGDHGPREWVRPDKAVTDINK
jgi:hypothetical protein